jgi:hypothetical protein
MAKVSEQALAECRAAVCVGSAIPVNDPALDRLVEEVRPHYEVVLDDDTEGAQTWKRDRPRMLFQCACIGSLAALTAKLKKLNATEVDEASLVFAYEFVKAGCDLRFQTDPQFKMFTKYCGTPTQQPQYADLWEQALGGQ